MTEFKVYFHIHRSGGQYVNKDEEFNLVSRKCVELRTVVPRYFPEFWVNIRVRELVWDFFSSFKFNILLPQPRSQGIFPG